MVVGRVNTQRKAQSGVGTHGYIGDSQGVGLIRSGLHQEIGGTADPRPIGFLKRWFSEVVVEHIDPYCVVEGIVLNVAQLQSLGTKSVVDDEIDRGRVGLRNRNGAWITAVEQTNGQNQEKGSI